jgi:LPXTG-motif cell wall-anchored protein
VGRFVPVFVGFARTALSKRRRPEQVMNRILTIPLSLLALSLWQGPALAHLGHVGELTGHSHWIGLAGLAAAAGIAALLPRRKRKDREKTEPKAEPAEAGGAGNGEQAA